MVRVGQGLASFVAGILSLLAALALVLAPAASTAADAPPKTVNPAPAFDGKQLTAAPKDSWITNGGNLYNQRYSAWPRSTGTR